MEPIQRRKTRVLKLRDLYIGGDNPVSVQSMTSTPTEDVTKTLGQIRALESAGCQVIRLAVPDMEAAVALAEIRKATDSPLIADIHFNYRLALEALKHGIDGLRLNPGNIGSEANVMKVVDAAREKRIPIRIGVNSGSVEKELLEKYGVTPLALVESALKHVAILEKCGYQEMKISVKASSVPMMIEAYRILSDRVDYPLHLGVTEAGTEYTGTIRSSVGIGTLLSQGIGDTIRVSLTADPVKEVYVGFEILKALDLRQGLHIVSCPTCGRTRIDLVTLAQNVEKSLDHMREIPITVAVMGCVVNGPGEAREADYGIAGGIGEGLVFRKGEIVTKVPEDRLIETLLAVIREDFPGR